MTGGGPNAPSEPARANTATPFPTKTRLAMVLLGLIPAAHFLITTLLLTAPLTLNATYRAVLLGLFVLFLLPPLIVRTATLIRPLPTGTIPLGRPGFLLWWFTAQWQVIFNRLPFLEELLRLIPGLYSLWMRLWGARVGALTYWSPGVRVLDRPLLRVGKRVVFGVGARVNPHILMPGPQTGVMSLAIGPVNIGDDALVGGYSFLPPGATVGSGETLPGFRKLRLFSQWRDGREERTSAPEA